MQTLNAEFISKMEALCILYLFLIIIWCVHNINISYTNILVTLVLIEHRSPNAPSGYAFPIQLTADVSVLKNPLYAGESVGVHLRPASPSIIKACPAQ